MRSHTELLVVFRDLATLSEQPGTTGRLLRLVSQSGEPNLYAEYVPKTREHRILMPLPRPEAIVAMMPEWRGVKIEAAEANDAPHLAATLLGTHPELLPVFARLAEDLAITAADNPEGEATHQAVLARLLQWQEILRRQPTDLLSPEEQRGLFAELHVLEKLAQIAGWPNALEAWVGPLHASHDFVSGTRAIEVKAAGQRAWPRVKISSEHQLADANLASLHLAAMLVGSSVEGESLSHIAKRLLEATRSSPQTFHAMDRKLFLCHLGPDKIERYNDPMLVTRNRTFHVRNGFPRIVSPIPGITRVRYELDLATCNEFQAEDLQVLLGGLAQ